MKSVDFNASSDREFFNIVSDILTNDEFVKLEEYGHHNSNRLQHSVNVAYRSYKLSKKFNWDVRKTARAALLHDFFLVDNYTIDKKNRVKTLFHHPDYALDNSLKYFELSDKEQNIIKTHMFPIGIHVPKYKESVLVDVVDDYISIREAMYAKNTELKAAFHFLLIFAFNCTFK